jgi:putative aldouronate transport system permease protein
LKHRCKLPIRSICGGFVKGDKDMKIKRTVGEHFFDIVNVLIMFILAFIMFYPLWHVVTASLSNNNLLMSHRGLLFAPLDINIDSYKMVFKNPMIITGYANTIFIVLTSVTLNIILTALGAYFLSRKNVFWRNPIMFLIIFTMYFSGGLIPNYLLISKTLNLSNSFLSLILPTAITTYNLIIMRTSFAAVPDSLEESAKLDGASHFTILFRIVLPLSMAVVAVLILYYAVSHWNAWFNASIYIRERKKYPLQLILREILINNDTTVMTQGDFGVGEEASIGETIKYAVIVVATLPILCVYPYLQKYFVKGVMIGSLKG